MTTAAPIHVAPDGDPPPCPPEDGPPVVYPAHVLAVVDRNPSGIPLAAIGRDLLAARDEPLEGDDLVAFNALLQATVQDLVARGYLRVRGTLGPDAVILRVSAPWRRAAIGARQHVATAILRFRFRLGL